MNCTNTNIPEIDNSNQECCDFYPSSCVIVNKRFPAISPKQDLTLNEFIEELVDIIKSQNYKIKLLETKINEQFPEVGIGTFD